ncbi:MAG: SOS response-associated peptidase [Burkholderiales bacterium]
MCGRYVLTSPGEAIAEHFHLADIPAYPPRYNIAPTQTALVVRETPAGRREAVGLRWGLVPFWAKAPSIGSRLINARAEGLADKPAFRAAFRRRRCLVPADGFFEWRALAGRRKQPYYVRLASGEPFAMAGLWEQWRPPEGDAIATFTIVTTAANAALRALHDRMPVIVASADYDEWLSSPNPSALLGSPAGAAFEIVPIGTRVNDVRNDDPDVLQPLPGV